MSEPRFFVDDRCGCVAVRDRWKIDPEEQGLHSDSEGTVQFWSKPRRRRTCPTCGHSTDEWHDGDVVQLAISKCAQLNEVHPTPAPVKE